MHNVDAFGNIFSPFLVFEEYVLSIEDKKKKRLLNQKHKIYVL